MRIVYVTLLALLFVSTAALANHKKNTTKKATSSFHRVIGGKSFDAARKVVKLSDGGFLVAGRSASYGMGDTDMLLVRVNSSGETLWQKTYGEDETDEANDIIATKDGGFLVVGHSDSYGYSPDIKDMWAIKVNAQGEELWNKTFGGEETIDEANAVLETEDGYMLVGTTISTSDDAASDILVVRINKNGDEVWNKTYGESGNEQGIDIIRNGDGFTIVGNTEGVGYEEGFSKGRWDIMTLHITTDGTVAWKNAYGGKNNEMGNTIIATSDGGYLLGGYTYSFAVASLDAWVVKIDNMGKQLWSKNFGGLSTDEAFALIETTDGNIVMAGYTEVFEANEDYENISTEKLNIFLVKMTPNGDKVWERSIGGEHNQQAFDIVEAKDGGLIVVGTTDAKVVSGVDVLIMKFDASGTF
ncbi:MAG: hypothetical protein ACPGJS_08215 [Flammeovirgaceae bacterium]